MWFYQLSEDYWPPTSYRIDIWENERWSWPVGNKISAGATPQPGDTIVFFYSKGCSEPGFYGWAVVLSWEEGTNNEKDRLYFRPVSPSDRLKMHPWGNPAALQLADDVRGKMRQATLWLIGDENTKNAINAGILSWTGLQTTSAPAPVPQPSSVKPA
jgi:hypothetical protein